MIYESTGKDSIALLSYHRAKGILSIIDRAEPSDCAEGRKIEILFLQGSWKLLIPFRRVFIRLKMLSESKRNHRLPGEENVVGNCDH